MMLPGLLFLSLLIASVVVWIRFLSRVRIYGRWDWGRSSGEFQRTNRPVAVQASRPLPCLLLAGLILLATFLSRQTEEPVELTLSALQATAGFYALAGFLLLAALLVPALMRDQTGVGETAESEPVLRRFGMNVGGRPLLRADAAAALRTLVFGLAPVFAVSWLLVLLGIKTTDNQHPLLGLLQEGDSGPVLLWVTLSAVVVAPLFEELLFRVILQGTLEQRFGPVVGIVGSSGLFAMAHEWPDLLPIFVLSLFFGGLYHVRGRYLSVVLAHAMFNGLNVLTTVFAPEIG